LSRELPPHSGFVGLSPADLDSSVRDLLQGSETQGWKTENSGIPHLVKNPVAVEKLHPTKFAKIKLRQEALQSIFSVRPYIFHPPTFGCFGTNGEFFNTHA
jgi:hypothetical protein